MEMWPEIRLKLDKLIQIENFPPSLWLLFTCSTFRLGIWRKESMSLTFTCGCSVWKHAWILCSLFWLSCEHIVFPDHKSSVDPNLLWSHSAVSPEAILKRNFYSVLTRHRIGRFIMMTYLFWVLLISRKYYQKQKHKINIQITLQ